MKRGPDVWSENAACLKDWWNFIQIHKYYTMALKLPLLLSSFLFFSIIIIIIIIITITIIMNIIIINIIIIIIIVIIVIISFKKHIHMYTLSNEERHFDLSCTAWPPIAQ